MLANMMRYGHLGAEKEEPRIIDLGGGRKDLFSPATGNAQVLPQEYAVAPGSASAVLDPETGEPIPGQYVVNTGRSFRPINTTPRAAPASPMLSTYLSQLGAMDARIAELQTKIGAAKPGARDGFFGPRLEDQLADAQRTRKELQFRIDAIRGNKSEPAQTEPDEAPAAAAGGGFSFDAFQRWRAGRK